MRPRWRNALTKRVEGRRWRGQGCALTWWAHATPVGGSPADGQLREFDRCRLLYEKYLEFNPANVYAWIKYAELEKLLEEVRRCACIGEGRNDDVAEWKVLTTTS